MQPTQTFMHALRHTHALSCIHIGYSYDNVSTYVCIALIQCKLQFSYILRRQQQMSMCVSSIRTYLCTYVYTVILHSWFFAVYLYGTYNQRVTIAQLYTECLHSIGKQVHCMAHTVDGVILFQINSDCVWTIGIVACLYIQVYAVAMDYSTRPKTPCRLKECLANTALFSAIALVALLFSLPTVVFLAFHGSDMSSWQESFSILSSFDSWTLLLFPAPSG